MSRAWNKMLVCKKTGKLAVVGEVYTDFAGDTCWILKSFDFSVFDGFNGRVQAENVVSGIRRDFIPAILGLEWVDMPEFAILEERNEGDKL